ncbi:ABC-2 type transport system permease protein [Evansella caseinilytica]|uniref:ABC-2 type transport system permease protein n=1 Tax=Evansella caseinilytica TaxID=1503961 RepID=A0A1H3QUF4_9BACI|nr:ABC transporter permease subunit [Evansella caseinilytica]SDZ16655.1 ABC-2 type transport system permease protein [Evansella caseinilytica]
MFHKALWYQNYKQTRMVVWILLVLYIVHLPFQTLLTIESWRKQLEELSLYPDWSLEILPFEILGIFSRGILPFILMFTIILFACMLIGSERNTRRMDFTFSLPFSRKDLFLAKLLYGGAMIIVFHTSNFLIAYWILKQSEFSYVLDLVKIIQIYYGPLLGLLLIFSFAMFIGTISGEMISQIAMTVIFGVFPPGFGLLLVYFFEINFHYYFIENFYPTWIENFTILFYTFNHPESVVQLLYPVIGTAVFTALGIVLYERNNIEHNGEFLIFKVLHPIFLIGMTFCFSLLGGMIFTSLTPWNVQSLEIVTYWVGAGVFFLFSYLITKRVLRMNLLVKNK